MKNQNIKDGIIYATLGSLWWGLLGTYFFQYISFAGTIEVVTHRTFWTCIILFFTTIYLNKWSILKKIIFNFKNLLILFITSLLILSNWTTWIYAVATERIIDASYGYFIFPIINVLFGNLFFNEQLNFKRYLSITIVVFSCLYLLFFINSLPWLGLLVALFWGAYNILRKKINVDTDIGLFVESLFVFPISLIVFYIIYSKGMNEFTFSNPLNMFLLFLAGPMTVIPLFLFIKGLEKAGLGPSGMIFFVTPTAQFLLGYFYFNEYFSIEKLISFILIWIAVIIYIKDIYENS